ncbi:MAG: flagellar hook protein FlgE [Maricaulaceae bacterium]|jgi:flagellar hook protein FlgE
MSLNSALSAGTAGLLANAGSLAAISDNIANVNTVAYKRTQTLFDPLVKLDSSANAYNAGGVQATTRQLIASQGLLTATTSSTDLAVSGNGFFVVTDQPTVTAAGGNYAFTRSGSFLPDETGNLVNSAGLYLQGWPVQDDGTVNANPSDMSQLEAVNVSAIGGTAQASTSLQFNANLLATDQIRPEVSGGTYDPTVSGSNMASYDAASGTGVEPNFQTSVQIFDSQGSLRTLNFAFAKSTTPNQWLVEIYASPASDVTLGAGLVDGQLATGTVAFTSSGAFDAANSTIPGALTFGAFDDPAPGAGAVNWANATGVAAQTVALDFGGPNSTGGLTQLDSPSALISSSVDGAVFGNLSGVEVDDRGFVVARFNNGVIRPVYQLPLATFINPNGLKADTGGSYRVSTDSGAFTLQQAGQGGAGIFASQALEASNVDLATEFTGLITTQRAYSAASKIIMTADEMLDELIRIKR